MAQLDIFSADGSRTVVDLDGEAVTIGRKAEYASVVIDDSSVSRLHATLTPSVGGLIWTVEDEGSLNGTFLDGVKILGKHKLQHNNELRIGGALLIFRQPDSDAGSTTNRRNPPPQVRPREIVVLKELCRPYYGHSRTKRAASRKEIAERCFIGEPAVQAHLSNMYDRFQIPEGCDLPHGVDRRDALAEFAMEVGIVTPRLYDEPSDEVTA